VTDAAIDRERVANYVWRALPRELAEREIPWQHALEWDEEAIRLTLQRSDLRISRTLTLGGPAPDAWADGEEGPWWTPVTKEWAQELTRRLVHIVWFDWLPLRDAGETGRLHVTVWRDSAGRYLVEPVEGAEAVRLVLEPGLMIDRPPATQRVEVRRLFEPRGATVAEALEVGWARLE
jgi:hypothetical protein